MSFKIKLLGFIFFSLFFSFIFPKNVHAATYTLDGTIEDGSSAPIENVVVDVINPSTSAVVTTTTSDQNGYYTTNVDEGTYNIQLTPQSGSGFSSAIALNQEIITDKTVNFTLVNSDSAVLSGYVLDRDGGGLEGQHVILEAGSILVQTITDSDGYYSLQANTGTYSLKLQYPNSGNSNTTKAPQRYVITVPNYLLSQSTMINFTIPAKEVSVHIQDSGGGAIENVQLQVPTVAASGISIGGGLIASATNDYGIGGFPKPLTDQNGDATLWLFANTSSNPYSIVATPPIGIGVGATTATNIVFTNDNPQTIILPNAFTLSGFVYDATGSALVGQNVALTAGSTTVQTTSGSDGSYSIEATSGTYTIQLEFPSGGNGFATHAPQKFVLTSPGYSLTQNVNLNLTLPAKKVDFHVKNAAGNGVSGVGIQIPTVSVSNQPIGGGLIASGTNSYGVGGFPQPQTDQNGDLTVWVLANNSSNPYSFTANPASGSEYAQTTLSN